jgi:hypothetical protein
MPNHHLVVQHCTSIASHGPWERATAMLRESCSRRDMQRAVVATTPLVGCFVLFVPPTIHDNTAQHLVMSDSRL